MSALFEPRTLEDLIARATHIPEEVQRTAREILHEVAAGGETAVRAYATRFDGLGTEDPLFLSTAALQESLDAMTLEDRNRLIRIAGRIERFAKAQLDALQTLRIPIDGGSAGHTILPVDRAGCYAPGGRYPLPSSVLMTALTARVAGVTHVWVASPRPAPITRAAAALARVDGLLAAGGAQAIAAFVHGAGPMPAVDVIAGPGNRYVTAAKQQVAGRVGIDMLAGPSELVVLADANASSSLVAADLLAQAEHDPDALPILATWSPDLAAAVRAELTEQLKTLPSAETARAALRHGGYIVCRDVEEAVDACNRLAPEHLEIMTEQPEAIAPKLRHCGGLFLGARSAEVFGDYGVGPNHVLPTGRAARSTAGLSVMTFLRARTWLSMDGDDDRDQLIDDVAWLARAEGLEAHARAAEARRHISARA
jgi:phosphoribosyl-ATP pyrophosphohydrolase/phosphoribosyl-AMP cyclohydrolase/histidinol dehydrogenase